MCLLCGFGSSEWFRDVPRIASPKGNHLRLQRETALRSLLQGLHRTGPAFFSCWVSIPLVCVCVFVCLPLPWRTTRLLGFASLVWIHSATTPSFRILSFLMLFTLHQSGFVNQRWVTYTSIQIHLLLDPMDHRPQVWFKFAFHPQVVWPNFIASSTMIGLIFDGCQGPVLAPTCSGWRIQAQRHKRPGSEEKEEKGRAIFWGRWFFQCFFLVVCHIFFHLSLSRNA